MAKTLILSLYPSDSSLNKALRHRTMVTPDKNYQLLKSNIDPLRLIGVKCA